MTYSSTTTKVTIWRTTTRSRGPRIAAISPRTARTHSHTSFNRSLSIAASFCLLTRPQMPAFSFHARALNHRHLEEIVHCSGDAKGLSSALTHVGIELRLARTRLIPSRFLAGGFGTSRRQQYSKTNRCAAHRSSLVGVVEKVYPFVSLRFSGSSSGSADVSRRFGGAFYS